MPSRIKTLWTNSWIVAHRDTTKTKTDSLGSFRKQQSGRAFGKLMVFFSATALIGLLAGCASVAQSKPQGPVQVSVAQVACRQFGETDEFTGRLEAVNTVEVRPRVSGYLESVNFKEGAIVRRGALLFQIDPRPFQAEVDRLKGDLAEARAALSRAQSDFERAERLHNNNGMSAEEYDRRAAARSQSEAHIASTQAALKGAELNLEFTRITAPITGRVGRAQGTLSEAGRRK
jgi:membrane fusion protein, multidrug efflux system